MNTLAPKYDHGAFAGTPWEQGHAREQALIAGLGRLAAKFGVAFKPYRHINSWGEFDLFLEDGQCYGDEFAALLCKHSPRTGIAPTKYLDGVNSWCMMNHFDVACMLEEAGV